MCEKHIHHILAPYIHVCVCVCVRARAPGMDSVVERQEREECLRKPQHLYSTSLCLFSSDTIRACAAAGTEGFAEGASFPGAPLSIAAARLRLLLVRDCTAPGLFNPFNVTVTTTASSSSACACCPPPFRIRPLLLRDWRRSIPSLASRHPDTWKYSCCDWEIP
jgi:hypothetical protein